jgi:hypothetical protein
VFRQRNDIRDIPTTMKAAAFEVLAEASAASDDLRGHARRAAAISGDAAVDAMETGLQAGTQAWRDARRQAAEWGVSALEQARSRPGVVLIGVAMAGLAVGFWLRGTSRRAMAPAHARRTTRTSTKSGARRPPG